MKCSCGTAAELYDFDDEKVKVLCHTFCCLFLLVLVLLLSLSSDLLPATGLFLAFLLMKDENKLDFKKIVSENWIEPPKRERKRK